MLSVDDLATFKLLKPKKASDVILSLASKTVKIVDMPQWKYLFPH